MDENTVKIGLLMETAEAHQQIVHASLERLMAHTGGLDALVREEIRHTLADELQALATDSRRAAEALQALRRVANIRIALWSSGMTALSCAAAWAVIYWTLPSASEIARLRSQRDQLSLEVSGLEQRGGRIDLRQCGEGARLCVRVERKAPMYGPNADYLVVKGY